MRKLSVLLFFLSLLVLGTSFAQTSLLDTIKARGKLVCGVNGTGLVGFGNVGADGEWTGFDVDFCRAIAAAVLGDANAVEFRGLSAQERFTAVQTGEVDVLIRNTTWTSSRDTAASLEFAPTNFYDGQGFMARADSGITTLNDLEGRRICVQSGTTTELNLADVLGALGISFTPVVFENNDQLTAAYDDGACDAWTTDRSGLVASQTRLREPAAHVILDQTISKEPLAPSVLDGDEKWYDAVKWIVYSLIAAEEFGVTSENVESVAAETPNPELQRMLNNEGDIVTQIGLPADGLKQAIMQVGNYGEIFNRNLGPDTPFNLGRGLNALYTDGGLMYAPPFR